MVDPNFDSNYDAGEEFEFQPLTEGLGFHKKAEKIKQDVKSSLSSNATGVGASWRDSGRDSGRDSKRDAGRGAGAISAGPATPASSSAGISTPAQNSRAKSSAPSMAIGSAASTASTTSMPSSRASSLDFPSATDSARPASQSISDLIASLPPSLDFIDEKPEPSKPSSLSTSKAAKGLMPATDSFTDRPQIFQPLGRDDYKSPSLSAGPTVGQNLGGPTIGSMMPTPGTKAGGSLAPGAPVVPAIQAPTAAGASASSSPYRERLDESFARAFPHAEKSTKRETVAAEPEGLQSSPVNLASGILDGMVVAGVSTTFLVSILAITRINLVGLLTNAHTDGATQLNLGLLFLCVSQMYLLIARSFFGASLGEWAFDMQLGSDDDQKKLSYPLRVAWRTLLVTITGIILLPILSAITKKDLAKHLTGLQLYRRP